ncbi:hypothetical protein M422DRAFT_249902 [Sphaerobolus stellatus SS14]|uniref:Uncharacterized protein n=1 Tax=Sphaerobolus stellatus (strain SS14) TaxID=990650 RepID=A0A0C9VUS5_SPHS4|nr:hypothetical protein M422DRAFT_249902 [Sphaerobolus stellatus SS14]
MEQVRGCHERITNNSSSSTSGSGQRQDSTPSAINPTSSPTSPSLSPSSTLSPRLHTQNTSRPQSSQTPPLSLAPDRVYMEWSSSAPTNSSAAVPGDCRQNGRDVEYWSRSGYTVVLCHEAHAHRPFPLLFLDLLEHPISDSTPPLRLTSQLNYLPNMDSNPKKRAMDRLIPESLTKKFRKTDLPSEPPGDVSSSAFTTTIVPQQPLESVAAASNSNEGAVSNSTSTPSNNRPEGGARKRNVAKAAIKETLRTIVNVTDVFPPLKSVTAGILERPR